MKQKSWLTEHQCELHDHANKIVKLIEQFILNPKYHYLKETEIHIGSEATIEELKKYDYPIDYLIDNDIENAKVVITKQILYGLIIDFCYFMQEALSCAERGRTVVAYSLLRRPFVFNFIILIRLTVDENFMDRFINDETYDPTQYKPEELKQMLSAIDETRIVPRINGQLIYDLVFDKENPHSVLNLSNRAIHPTTTRKCNQTGAMNFNFIFVNDEDIHNLLEVFYDSLIPVLLYYFELINLLVIPFIPEKDRKNTVSTQYKDLLACLD